MSRLKYASLAAIILLTSCQHDSAENTVSSRSQSTKPHLAIAPLIDNTKQSIAWSLSDEITYSLFYKLDQKDKFHIEDPQKTLSVTRKLQSSNDPFSDDLKWVKRSFSKNDFVVFLEMLQHEEVPNLYSSTDKPQDCSSQLKMAMRVVLVDVRSEQPKVILQEIVNDTHFIPKQFNQYNFHQASWGSEEFYISPLGMAHSQFLKEISSRIEDYIQLAQSV